DRGIGGHAEETRADHRLQPARGEEVAMDVVEPETLALGGELANDAGHAVIDSCGRQAFRREPRDVDPRQTRGRTPWPESAVTIPSARASRNPQEAAMANITRPDPFRELSRFDPFGEDFPGFTRGLRRMFQEMPAEPAIR